MKEEAPSASFSLSDSLSHHLQVWRHEKIWSIFGHHSILSPFDTMNHTFHLFFSHLRTYSVVRRFLLLKWFRMIKSSLSLRLSVHPKTGAVGFTKTPFLSLSLFPKDVLNYVQWQKECSPNETSTFTHLMWSQSPHHPLFHSFGTDGGYFFLTLPLSLYSIFSFCFGFLFFSLLFSNCSYLS